jgi:hypothetical protein
MPNSCGHGDVGLSVTEAWVGGHPAGTPAVTVAVKSPGDW